MTRHLWGRMGAGDYAGLRKEQLLFSCPRSVGEMTRISIRILIHVGFSSMMGPKITEFWPSEICPLGYVWGL